MEAVHRQIFEVAITLIKAGKLATPITLKTYLGDADLGGVTPMQYLARLAAEATTVINAGEYGRTIYDLAIRRRLITIGEDMVNGAYEAPVESRPRDQIEATERRLYELAESGKYDGGFQKFSDALTAAIDMAAKAYQRDGKLSGISTGLTDLDAKMGGLQPSDLIILAGRPAMGKTSLVTNIAFNIAKAYRGGSSPTARCRPSTAASSASSRWKCRPSSSPPASSPSNPACPPTRSAAATSARRLLQDHRRRAGHADHPVLHRPDGGISIAQLAARARRLKRQKGLDLLIIDYLQLLSGSGKKSDNRVQEMTEITTGMKALAKELAVPIIGLSQLSRQVENRDDKRPQLSDLRESGSIEQDADVVMFVFREEYYVGNKKPREGTEEFFAWEQEMQRVHGKAEVILGKQRHGPTGTVELQFDANITRFSNLAQSDRMPEQM